MLYEFRLSSDFIYLSIIITITFKYQDKVKVYRTDLNRKCLPYCWFKAFSHVRENINSLTYLLCV